MELFPFAEVATKFNSASKKFPYPYTPAEITPAKEAFPSAYKAVLNQGFTKVQQYLVSATTPLSNPYYILVLAETLIVIIPKTGK